MLKIWRSPYSRFGVAKEHPNDLEDETILAEKSYTDEILKGIADCGFNAIWVHGQLHHIIPNRHFPEFAVHGQMHQDALHRLCARAKKYGIQVIVYMQPPRAIPVSDTAFWAKHQDCAGQLDSTPGDDNKPFDIQSLCTSVPYVQDYLRESFADFARAVPELGGFMIISASEYPATCYSRRNCRPGEIRPRKWQMDHIPTNCPRCGKRQPEDTVVELLNIIRDGVRSVSPTMNLIFWNWSWTMYLDPPCASIIERLPKDIYLLADFERGGWRKDGTCINEYSLGYAGPSEQYQDIVTVAAKRGMPVIPKFQLGTTHELATVRSLPILPSLFRKADYVRRNHLDGFLGCWNFGNLNSTSVKAFNWFLNLKEDLTCDEALRKFAELEYPGKDSAKIVQAWNLFSEAMDFYPFCVPFLYSSAVNHALSLIPTPGQCTGKPVGRSWLPDDRGDSYHQSESKEFPLDDIIVRLGKMAEIWERGLSLLEVIGKDHPDYGNAAICSSVWSSSYNLYRIYRMKLHWDDSKLPEYRKLAADELHIAETVLPYVAADPEQGWHVEGDFYAFSKDMIEQKITALKNALK